ncbi:MAG TPA: adenylate/guanylate cyclase domain-containing protein [Marinospirillum sp.]|uniref:CHASE2 domain-containing protein n=1 Tax=Marinospirillum sp. TaxID=2183934 RepID=UPI002B49593A|nr:adenylate/guanylate cyclase domain-containing protein [Marinospirillum sp.]HKM15986.1 adenylate/guanylate cyclase domain-containing protein [Marinospirillum sp.]
MSAKPAAPNTVLPPSVALTLRINPHASRLLLLLIVLPLLLLLMWLVAPQLRLFEERASEQRWAFAPLIQPEQRFVVVTIDEAALQQLGAWPWSRTTLAEVSAQLQQAGVALQIYDLILPEAKAGDDLFAAQLAQTPSVLGILPALDSNQNLQTGQLGQGILLSNSIHCQVLPNTQNYLGNAAVYVNQNVGHIAPVVSQDGVIRSQPPLVCVNGKAYPSLTLAALLAGIKPSASPELKPELYLEKGMGLFAPVWWLKASNTPVQLPLDAQGNLRLSYQQAPENFTTLSIADLMNNNYPPRLLSNAWVLVGATAFGLADVVPTPHAALTPGVELQARLLSALLDQNHTYQPQGAWLYQLIQVLLSAGLLLLLAANRQYNVTFLATAAAVLPLAQLAMHWMFLSHNLWLGWLLPALYTSLAAVALLLLEFARTRFERQRLYQNLSSYLPKGIADQIAFRKTTSQVEGSNQQLLVIYADLRNFNAWQEHLPAEETAALLHYFFITANKTLAMHGGTLHEFRGDAILAAWPVNPSNQTAQVQNAIAMVQQLQATLHKLLEAPPHPNLEPLALDFALDLGSVLMGSLGSAQRRSHLLLGQTVNRVIGIQKMTAEIGSTLLLGEQAAQTLPTEAVQSQGRYLLEGFTAPQELFTLRQQSQNLAKSHTNRVLQLRPQSR